MKTDIINRVIYWIFRVVILTGAGILAVACSSHSQMTIHRGGDVIQHSTTPLPDFALQQCKNDLVALKQINPQQWTMQQAEFNKLINAASRYASVRASAGRDTRAAIDALYQYKMIRFCANTSKALMNGLAEQGDYH
ncbi:hypothetical protein [Pantoea stewartii]|uniref:hypothetical protein n=1 Tax=Pantoea stewartii TaxID=66269 RepID=UPI001561F32B|nr:hypothetical protein [Pantoea stewartii]NRH23409.1 hypothetical protein [Pantoea stewartii]